MDIVSIANLLTNVPTDKIMIVFCLIGVIYCVAFISKILIKVLDKNTLAIDNNAKATDNLNITLGNIITNQKLHDERNKSDFKTVTTSINNVKDDVSRVEKDVASLSDDVNDISTRMATKDELQRVSATVSTIKGRIER
ncbi:hypothetical protein [Pectinatus frisingensis]|uniref:hypothetical protein n=1 Tax=Pectinatus frisingensis TaxID=865 RepID=UPI0018C531E5|nr:hypothetical protein [Pectinatus frisingensis]